MGNCLKSPPSDDISLLHESQSDRNSFSPDPDLDLEPPPPYLEASPMPLFHPGPGQTRPASRLTEEEQVRLAQRRGLIQQIPRGLYHGGPERRHRKTPECVICMLDFVWGDPVRFLPCMHVYHLDCIDVWLLRSFTCPSCMEPVHAALLSTYDTD